MEAKTIVGIIILLITLIMLMAIVIKSNQVGEEQFDNEKKQGWMSNFLPALIFIPKKMRNKAQVNMTVLIKIIVAVSIGIILFFAAKKVF